LNQFFAGAASISGRLRKRALNLSKDVEKLASPFQIRAKTPVQQEQQQGDERNNYQVFHCFLAIDGAFAELGLIAAAAVFIRSIRQILLAPSRERIRGAPS
jgi:hypothetical protein